jgi:hypothetical protein
MALAKIFRKKYRENVSFFAIIPSRSAKHPFLFTTPTTFTRPPATSGHKLQCQLLVNVVQVGLVENLGLVEIVLDIGNIGTGVHTPLAKWA